MVVIKNINSSDSDATLELLSLRLRMRAGRHPKVGVHRRKVKGKPYESPRILLTKEWAEFIGKSGPVYGGRAVRQSDLTRQEGDCLVFFFPDPPSEEQKQKAEALAARIRR